jgi:predicted nuclease of restriction endonuclease-like (RecB) superfamily
LLTFKSLLPEERETIFAERELVLGLVMNAEKFLLELGAGFAFVGRQYKLEISSTVQQ